MKNFIASDSVTDILCAGGVFNDQLLSSYSHAMLDKWQYELLERIIPSNLITLRGYTKRHTAANVVDDDMWSDIESLKMSLAKNSEENTSVFTSIKNAIESKSLKDISALQIRMNRDMSDLAALYREYCENQI